MTVSRYNNYIKISELSQEVLDNISDYESVLITGNINCCQQNCNDLINEYSLSLENIGWSIDLDIPVKLNSLLQTLNIQSIYSLVKYNALISPVDLSYVEDNCSVGVCTLEDFTGHFSPLFKSAIENWFTSIGLSVTATVTFDGNVMTVTGIPSGFQLVDTDYGEDEPFTSIPFGYTDALSNIFISSDSIYIKPRFFNNAVEFINGIYKFTIKWIKEDSAGYVEEYNCSFIDIDLKCKVASVLHNILKENQKRNSEQCSTVIHLLHYALVNGSNCGCNCDELCQVFKELVVLLETIDLQIVNNCGC